MRSLIAPLLDFDGDRRDGTCVNHLMDFRAVSNHHKVQVNGTLTRGAVDHSRSGAIRVDGIRPGVRAPLERGGMPLTTMWSTCVILPLPSK